MLDIGPLAHNLSIAKIQPRLFEGKAIRKRTHDGEAVVEKRRGKRNAPRST